MKTIQVLQEALAMIQRGFIKGEYEDIVDGVLCVCSSQAIFKASKALCGGTPEENEDAAARNALQEANGFRGIVKWNDDPKRTQAQVIRAFEKAIRWVKKEFPAASDR